MTMKRVNKSTKTSNNRRNGSTQVGVGDSDVSLSTTQRSPPHNFTQCPQCNCVLSPPEPNICIQTLEISEQRSGTNGCGFTSCPLRPRFAASSSDRSSNGSGGVTVSGGLILDESNHHSHNKKEKMGLIRNLRKKFSFRKSDVACNGNCEECQTPNINPNSACSRLKERNKKTSNSATYSHNCDCMNSSLQHYMSPKFNELHSNTNHHACESAKEKQGCISKNISDFKVESPHQCTEVTPRYNRRDPRGRLAGSDTVYELADCVEYDPAKEQTKIWSPRVWSLTKELFRLSKFGWYWGPITRNEAEGKLTNQPDGTFLVRDSSDERYLLSLSFRSYGQTWHTRIEHCNGMFSFYAQPDTEREYPSIVDLIEHSMNDSHTGIFYYSRSSSVGAPQFSVRLTKPVSRFTQVRSLQYLCRFVIRQYTRLDLIQQLPLPTTLKGWIEENQY